MNELAWCLLIGAIVIIVIILNWSDSPDNLEGFVEAKADVKTEAGTDVRKIHAHTLIESKKCPLPVDNYQSPPFTFTAYFLEQHWPIAVNWYVREWARIKHKGFTIDEWFGWLNNRINSPITHSFGNFFTGGKLSCSDPIVHQVVEGQGYGTTVQVSLNPSFSNETQEDHPWSHIATKDHFNLTIMLDENGWVDDVKTPVEIPEVPPNIPGRIYRMGIHEENVPIPENAVDKAHAKAKGNKVEYEPGTGSCTVPNVYGELGCIASGGKWQSGPHWPL